MKDNSRQFTRRALTVLFALGIVLGMTFAVAGPLAQDPSLLQRIQMRWQPGHAQVARGDTALRRGAMAAARAAYLEAAATAAAAGGDRALVLRTIVDHCERHQAWPLALEFARLAAQQGVPADWLRVARALVENRRPAEAEAYLLRITIAPNGPSPPNGSPAAGADPETRELAQGMLAYAYAMQDKDLTRACQLVENGIASENARGASPLVLAPLNDTLCWVHYRLYARSRDPRELELARIYGENAGDGLVSGTRASVSATVAYHLFCINRAAGRAREASRYWKRAQQLDGRRLAWLRSIDG